MGVCGYDKGAASKRYEQQYVLSTTKGVAKILKDMHKLEARAYERGDMAAIDIIIDFTAAIDKAGLTDRQYAALQLYYVHDLEQTVVAKRLGIDITTESRHRKAALERIVAIFREWEYN